MREGRGRDWSPCINASHSPTHNSNSKPSPNLTHDPLVEIKRPTMNAPLIRPLISVGSHLLPVGVMLEVVEGCRHRWQEAGGRWVAAWTAGRGWNPYMVRVRINLRHKFEEIGIYFCIILNTVEN